MMMHPSIHLVGKGLCTHTIVRACNVPVLLVHVSVVQYVYSTVV